jgi:hypothetical protein
VQPLRLARGEGVQRGHFGDAGGAPGRPQIDQQRPPAEIGKRHGAPFGILELRQRCGLAGMAAVEPPGRRALRRCRTGPAGLVGKGVGRRRRGVATGKRDEQEEGGAAHRPAVRGASRLPQAARLGYGRGMRHFLLPGFVALLLAACGEREALRPAAGQETPPAPAMAARAPTTEEMLTATPEARPERQEDTLRRSEEREDDRFDLPPTR